MHGAGDGQRAAHAEADRDRAQTVRAIEVEVLTRVEHVEAADPGANRQPEQPRLRCRRVRLPPASRPPAPRPSPGRGTAACSSSRASPANTRRRSPARRATTAGRSDRAARRAMTNAQRRHDDEDAGFRARHRPPRDLARRGAWIQGIVGGVHQPVETHRRAARRDHRDHDPAHPPCDVGERPRPGLIQRQQRASQGERQREDRVAEADEAGVGSQTVQGSGVRGSGFRCAASSITFGWLRR